MSPWGLAPQFVQCFMYYFIQFSELAMSPNNSEVHIYCKKAGKWEVETVLKNVSSLYTTFSILFEDIIILPSVAAGF